MKKILLGVFLGVMLINYAKAAQNHPDKAPHSQKENIDFSIKEAQPENTSNQDVPDASSATYKDATSSSMMDDEAPSSTPSLAPEITEKNWRNVLEKDEDKAPKPQAQEQTQAQQEQPQVAQPQEEPQESPAKKITNEKAPDEIATRKPKTKKAPPVAEEKAPAKKITREIKKDSKDSPKAPKKDLLEEKPQKTKKVTFIQEEFYNPKKNEMSISKVRSKLFLQINSIELQKFMEGIIYNTKQQVQTFALEDSYTQITNVDGKIQEYKYAQKSIDRYSAIAPHQKYPLKKISKNQYQIIVRKIPEFFDIKGCKIVIKKELTGTLNQTKEIIINLDTKRELRNNPHFDLFLECPQ